jgi:serine/threonine-protein phosphatase 2A regulatory subunit A
LIDGFRLLQEDIRDENYEVVISAINKLATVAISIGPNRVRSELLPFLLEYMDSSDNDEAQTEIAKELQNFTELIGGTQYTALLLTPLEKLCGEEEFVVRDTAVNSINYLLLNNKLTKADISNKFLPMLKRLANGDW